MNSHDVHGRRLVEDPRAALLRLDDEIAAARIALVTSHPDVDDEPLALSADGIVLLLDDLGDLVERYLRASGYRDVTIGGRCAA